MQAPLAASSWAVALSWIGWSQTARCEALGTFCGNISGRGLWADFAWKCCLPEEQRTVFLSYARYFGIPNQFCTSVHLSHEECHVPNHSWCDQREWDHPVRPGLEALMPCRCCPPGEGCLFVVQEWKTSQILWPVADHPQWPRAPTCDLQFGDYWPEIQWLWHLHVRGYLPGSTHSRPQCGGEHLLRDRWASLQQVGAPEECLASLAAPQPMPLAFLKNFTCMFWMLGEKGLTSLRQALGSDWRWVIVTTSLLLCQMYYVPSTSFFIFSPCEKSKVHYSQSYRDSFTVWLFKQTSTLWRKEMVVVFQQISSVPLLRRE